MDKEQGTHMTNILSTIKTQRKHANGLNCLHTHHQKCCKPNTGYNAASQIPGTMLHQWQTNSKMGSASSGRLLIGKSKNWFSLVLPWTMHKSTPCPFPVTTGCLLCTRPGAISISKVLIAYGALAWCGSSKACLSCLIVSVEQLWDEACLTAIQEVIYLPYGLVGRCRLEGCIASRGWAFFVSTCAIKWTTHQRTQRHTDRWSRNAVKR